MTTMEDSGMSVLMEVEDLETAVMRTHLALQQFIKERKRRKDFDVDELPVGGVVSLSFSLLPEVRRQLNLIRGWLREKQPVVIKVEEEDDDEVPEPENSNDESSSIILTNVVGEEQALTMLPISTRKGGKPSRRRRKKKSLESESGSSEGEVEMEKGESRTADPKNPRVKRAKIKVTATVKNPTKEKDTSESEYTPTGRRKKQIRCHICGETFKHRCQKKRHLERPPCGEKIMHPCPYCDKVLTRKDILKDHVKTLHSYTLHPQEQDN